MKEARESSLRKFFSYSGWIIGLLGFGIALYSEFFKNNHPLFEYDIVSATQFINDQESSSMIKIYVDTIDLQESNLNITAFNIKIENKGNENIRYDDYDNGFFGLRIINGSLLEPPTIVNASSEHIKALFPQIDSVNNLDIVDVPTVSLDIDDYYTIRIVLVHNIDSIPYFKPEGKIVGQKNIKINSIYPKTDGFWIKTFKGNWLTQTVRLFTYSFFMFLLIALASMLTARRENETNKKTRIEIIKQLEKDRTLLPLVKIDFIDNGESVISDYYRMYNHSEKEINEIYRKTRSIVIKEKHNYKNRDYYIIQSDYNSIKSMIEKGYLIQRADDSIHYNIEAQQSVITLFNKLTDEGIIYRYGNDITHLM